MFKSLKIESEKLQLKISQQEIVLTEKISDLFSTYRLHMESFQDSALKTVNNTTIAEEKEESPRKKIKLLLTKANRSEVLGPTATTTIATAKSCNPQQLTTTYTHSPSITEAVSIVSQPSHEYEQMKSGTMLPTTDTHTPPDAPIASKPTNDDGSGTAV